MTHATTRAECAQPGCHGTIVDNTCTVCSLPVRVGPPDESTADNLDAMTSSVHLSSLDLGSTRLTVTPSAPTRHLRPGTSRLRSGRLGAGLTQVPPAAPLDAESAILTDPTVPPGKRRCPICDAPLGTSGDNAPLGTSGDNAPLGTSGDNAPLGTSRDNEPPHFDDRSLTDGSCPRCGTPYSFRPKLAPGDLVANQYLVEGCLAHGGVGWIYLAHDQNVSDRWVVLKGLLNSEDPDALAAAINEQKFLAAVEHPLIVEIYNFVTHAGAGYIVMEYVGGQSLKQLLQQRRHEGGGYTPLPPEHALAYILEVLPAFSYLHDMGLLYCDFKPDNVIQVGDALKLIDLGGVRRMDDPDSAIYGTVGYQAPEVGDEGASIASDIYTIGRTLLILSAEVRGYQTRYLEQLPSVDDLPLFAQYDSLHRLIAKCCAPEPADRFSSADELRVQLLGVLRQVIGSHTAGTALTSASSLLFEPPAVSSSALEWWQLPRLRPDTGDAQYAWLSNVGATDPAERLTALAQAPHRTAEVQIARASAALELADRDLVTEIVSELLGDDPWEWRAVWLSGLAAVQAEDWSVAQAAFNAVYGQVPGELAPQLALALACEYADQGRFAERLYQCCASTDANFVSAAAFGIARVRQARGEVDGAVAALDLVPTTGRGYPQSRRLRAELLLDLGDDDLSTLQAAYASVDKVRLDPVDRNQLTRRILHRALDLVQRDGAAPGETLGPWPATEPGLRHGLESTYRALARIAPDPRERYRLVDQANRIRAWSRT